ncbi:MAG: hypothetical protein CVV27_16785 [Candidatus Melainabacteria bacterium HGW-Melainabacteria-1]|nr:MAG: hypothetical protein CVV27_16785 [Candidatus Melainabacteria bacterium HGW-Melainabacteria-1]
MPRYLQQLDTDIWILDQAFQLMGAEIGTRTTVLRLADGGLWLHSPGPDLAAAYRPLCELGPVRHLVAPNAFHHLYLKQAARLFPQAKIWGPGAVSRKQPQLQLNKFGDAIPAAWRSDLLMQPIKGTLAQEYVFLHRASGSLIVTDLLLHLFPEQRHLQLLFGLAGMHGRLTAEPLVSKLWLRDAAALRRSLAPIFEWDFGRIIMSHGRLVETDAKARFARAMHWAGADI